LQNDKESSATSTATSASIVKSYQSRTSPPRYSVGPKTPPHLSPRRDRSEIENPTFVTLPPHLFGKYILVA